MYTRQTSTMWKYYWSFWESELLDFQVFERLKLYRSFFLSFFSLNKLKYQNLFEKHPFQHWKETFNNVVFLLSLNHFKMVLYSPFFLFISLFCCSSFVFLYVFPFLCGILFKSINVVFIFVQMFLSFKIIIESFGQKRKQQSHIRLICFAFEYAFTAQTI